LIEANQTPNTTVLNDFMSPDDVAKPFNEFGFNIPKASQSKLRMASSNSNFPYMKTGKYIVYSRRELTEWFNSHKIA